MNGFVIVASGHALDDRTEQDEPEVAVPPPGVGLSILTCLPWCLPLWWQFRRLRMAIELDCDGRVLRASVRARDYARLLLDVAGRQRRVMVPLAAMGPPHAVLERRIRSIVSSAAPRHPRRAVAFLLPVLLVPIAAAVLPAPDSRSVAALIGPLRHGAPPAPGPEGSLPGTPSDQRNTTEIRTHHPTVISDGLPAGSLIWFIVGRDGAVMRTGVERGSEREVEARVRERHGREVSDFVMAFEGTFPEIGDARVLWLLSRM